MCCMSTPPRHCNAACVKHSVAPCLRASVAVIGAWRESAPCATGPLDNDRCFGINEPSSALPPPGKQRRDGIVPDRADHRAGDARDPPRVVLFERGGGET